MDLEPAAAAVVAVATAQVVAADSGQALDVARVSVQQVETVIPATKNIIRRKKYKNLASVGSTQVKIPFFTNAFPLQSRRNKGGSIPPPSDFVSNRRPKFKGLLFLLAPPPTPRFSDLPTALSLLS